jgi:pimeloyl-ACP methyl ester carboxylesterase
VTGRAPALLAAHRGAGSMFTAGGVESFVRAEGAGVPVVLVHGLPASSYLYRKVIGELAGRGLRAVAFDLPGMGLAERPAAFDYRIGGLGAFAAAAVDALDLSSFHLVVHDAGGPVGFELIRRRPEAIRSLTILDTVLALPSKPFPGEVWAKVSHRAGPLGAPWVWRQLMRRVGVADQAALTDADIEVYRLLALGPDDGAGYLRIMANLRRGTGGTYRDVVDSRRVPYPVQVLWGASDPILRLGREGMAMLAATGLPSLSVAPGRHYLQEDQAPLIASMVARLAAAVDGEPPATPAPASDPRRRLSALAPKLRGVARRDADAPGRP